MTCRWSSGNLWLIESPAREEGREANGKGDCPGPGCIPLVYREGRRTCAERTSIIAIRLEAIASTVGPILPMWILADWPVDSQDGEVRGCHLLPPQGQVDQLAASSKDLSPTSGGLAGRLFRTIPYGLCAK